LLFPFYTGQTSRHSAKPAQTKNALPTETNPATSCPTNPPASPTCRQQRDQIKNVFPKSFSAFLSTTQLYSPSRLNGFEIV